MSAHSDVELQILEHLRILRTDMASVQARLDGLERRLDDLAARGATEAAQLEHDGV